MYRCGNCGLVIENIICPHCDFDNTIFVEGMGIDINKDEIFNENFYDKLGLLGTKPINTDSNNIATEKSENNKNNNSDYLSINKKTLKQLSIIAIILIIIASCIVILTNLHTCSDCGKTFWGDGYTILGQRICKDCYDYILSGQWIPSLF